MAKDFQQFEIDKIVINLIDIIDFKMIQTPVKGKYCKHI